MDGNDPTITAEPPPGASSSSVPSAARERAPRPRAVLSAADGPLIDLLFPAELRRRLEETVALEQHTDPAGLLHPDARTAEAEILLLGWGSPALDATALARFPRLGLVAFAGGEAAKAIDPVAADAAGILRTNAGEANSRPVAEFTLAAVLLAGTGAFWAQRTYAREQAFLDREARMPTLGNHGRTVGIVGASRIGRQVISLLQRHDLRILLHDPTLDPAAIRALGCLPASLPELMRDSEIVSIHAPELPSTRGMISREMLALLPDGATLVNTARGSLVDQDALTEEVASGRLLAVLDVTEPDPLPAGHPLYTLPGAFLTPHVSGSLGRELSRLGEMILAEVERFVRGEPLRWQEGPAAASTM
ncbi:2-hydroxyacid dehydrogenase [Brachybacterium phenoliresistens]|uniref:2-hydroxyacid dehydrogenase n=1 Tax=Brachybacterium phenoliresistens TaxID=396014 RepID=Z9JV99_9MICO|nr:hydroxyacid dehydrogenase [Brachybacterium phenoliresistens]EWS82305.1 2-hydroxyacid dehydrogenase [Brachybacterium phenoliresistens]